MISPLPILDKTCTTVLGEILLRNGPYIYSSTTTNTTFSDTHLSSPQSFESASESFQIKKLTKDIDSNSTFSIDCPGRALDLYDYSCYSLKSSSS